MKLPISAIRRFVLMGLAVGMLSSFAVAAQNIRVSGTVKDAKTGEPLPGVNVIEKGTTNGIATDMDGKYALSVPKGSTLVFTFIGYQPQEVPATSATLNVSLEPITETIDEVVVIGYGTVKKSDATGSVQAISSKEFNKGAVVNPEQLIQGKTPGVVITSSGGAPGSGATVRIRGGSSISASNDPLYVIDGVAIDNNSIAGMSNPLNSINPNDIESISVLKDASATAIYGARASNGVIIITTKKGTSGLKVSYLGKAIINTVAKYTDVLSAEEFTATINTIFNDPTKPTYNKDVAPLLGKDNTDWQKKIFRTAWGTDQSLSVSSQLMDNFPIRVSFGYTKENGTQKTSSFGRTTGSISLSPKFFDNTLSVLLNVKGVYTDNTFPNGGAVGSSVSFDPTKPVRSDAAAYKPYGGYFTWLTAGQPNTIATRNPVALLEQTTDNSYVYRSIGNLQLDYKLPFVDGLRANLNIGYDYSKSNGKYFNPENAAFAFNTQLGNGLIRNYSELRRTQLLDAYLNYNKAFENDIIQLVDVTAGYSWQRFWRSGKSHQETLAGKDKRDNRYISENYLISFFGRANVTLFQYFLLTGTVRYDGSSRFSTDNRWGIFPSAALAWKISDMPFMQNMDNVNELKLRLGWGITGQQDIIGGDYPALGIYSYGINGAMVQFGYDAQGKPFFVDVLRPGPYNQNLKWEEARTANIGLDFGFFNNRLYGSIDIYQKKTNNLINFIPIPAGTNFSNQVWANVGNMKNNGIEFSVTGKAITKPDMTLDINFNMAYNKNKITKLLQNQDPNYQGVPTGGIGGGTGNTIQINSVGYPRNEFFVYEQVFDENGKPIEGVYVDQNKDGLINNLDLIHRQNADPDVTLGIGATLTYKDWDFTFAGRANIGNYVYNNIASQASYLGMFDQSNYLSNQPTYLLKQNFYNRQLLSSYFVQPASFFKMDYIGLGYRFENIFKSKINARLSAIVQNVFTITKYDGIDPEYSNGIDNNIYPRPRTYVISLSLDL